MPKVEEVVEYLKQNPTFFDRHGDLLGELDFSGHPDTPSFHERQLQVLKDRENEQRAKLDIIMNSAKANLQLEQELHELCAHLISDSHTNGFSQVTLIESIMTVFSLDEIAIVKEPTHKELTPNLDYSLLSQRVAHLGSVCDDRLSSSLLDSVFVDSSKKIQSCAFIPLSVDQELRGVMVLGAIAQDRFKPGFGVMFLDRLGRIVSAYLEPELSG